MAKVRIQQFSDGKAIGEIDLDVIPRIGERISIFDPENEEAMISWAVARVTHELIINSLTSALEHVIIISISLLSETPQSVTVEWKNEDERPDWIPDDLDMMCDVIPQRGDVIQIGVNDARYATDEMPLARVEVIAVVHVTLLDPPRQGDTYGTTDQTTVAIVVRNAHATSDDIQRILVSRRN